jgi:ribosomal protein S18 acetylase RimI-like enzyme
MMDHKQIRQLELLGHNAWVAEERMRVGGWLLRADHGVTRRANSVLPLEPPGLSLSLAIESIIDFYESRELTPRFQMTEASQPTELDKELEKRGFSVGLQVEVWTARLSILLSAQPTCISEVLATRTQEWTDTFKTASGHEASTMDTRFSIMSRTLQPSTYALARVNNVPAAVGFGVVEGSWLGIFGIATLPEARHKGAATSVNRELGIWAQKLGAKHAYLQVETTNRPAKNLYTKLGFKHAYTYWYRDLNSRKESECRSW